MSDTHLTAPTRFIEADGGDRFAYRRWGKPFGVPLFFVPHSRYPVPRGVSFATLNPMIRVKP